MPNLGEVLVLRPCYVGPCHHDMVHPWVADRL